MTTLTAISHTQNLEMRLRETLPISPGHLKWPSPIDWFRMSDVGQLWSLHFQFRWQTNWFHTVHRKKKGPTWSQAWYPVTTRTGSNCHLWLSTLSMAICKLSPLYARPPFFRG
jgi:hypothetical protein